jgi:alpha-tubulin suppressor-like RCC1 family protein
LRKDGTVWAWGNREDGRDRRRRGKPGGSLRVLSATAPVAVRGLTGITQIAAGPNYNLALTRDGKVMSWGGNGAGEAGRRHAGDGLGTPGGGHGAWSTSVAIAAGSGLGAYGVSSRPWRKDGTLWVWGSGSSAQMGNWRSLIRHRTIPAAATCCRCRSRVLPARKTRRLAPDTSRR